MSKCIILSSTRVPKFFYLDISKPKLCSKNYSKKVIINPGMGFGTGGHETTKLCLKLLNGKKSFDRVLDLGCGSGVLGLFCELYFGSEVDYVDVDQDAINNCIENRKLNNSAGRGSAVLRRDFVSHGYYDLILANILKPVLESEAETIIGSLAKGGEIILSGLLHSQYDELLDFYRNRFNISFDTNVINDGDWVAIRLSNILGN